MLWAVPFDLPRLQVTGGPVSIVEGVARGFGGVGLATSQFSVADSGSLVYIPGPASASSARRTLVSIDQKGTTQPLKVPAGADLSPRVAPDGTRVAVVTDDGKDVNIWIYDLTGATSMRATDLRRQEPVPHVVVDSRRVVFQSDRGGDLGMRRQPADGSGPAERLTTADRDTADIPESWLTHGQAFSFSLGPSTGDVSLWMFSLSTRRAEPVNGVRSQRADSIPRSHPMATGWPTRCGRPAARLSMSSRFPGAARNTRSRAMDIIRSGRPTTGGLWTFPAPNGWWECVSRRSRRFQLQVQSRFRADSRATRARSVDGIMTSRQMVVSLRL